MRAGEKILFYRKQAGLTQKKLAELSGVSEISIRKYELGSRNPKPEQLKKLGKAMGLGENILLDIEVADISLETIGDFMAVLYQFIEKMDCFVTQNQDGEGNYLESSTRIGFTNPLICHALSEVATHFASIIEAREGFLKTDPTSEELANYYLTEQSLIELQKKYFLEWNEPLIEPNAPVNKPMPNWESLFPPETEE